jgi:hypothetical protein
VPLKNAYIFNFDNFSGDADNSYDFTKIKYIKGISSYEEGDFIKILIKCPNIEVFEFYDIGSDYLMEIIKKINCTKVKTLTAVCQDMEDDFDWNIVFEKCPLIENISIEEHQTMFWSYEISPIFLAERKRVPFPLLEQLINNYLNGSPDRDISLNFDEEFNEFWDFFKNKKYILDRVSGLTGYNYYEMLHSYFKVIINKNNNVDKIEQGKYLYLFVEIPFNDKILEFIKKNKVEYLIIKEGGNIDLDELIKCDSLKFIFISSNKNFYFRKNNILEKI